LEGGDDDTSNRSPDDSTYDEGLEVNEISTKAGGKSVCDPESLHSELDELGVHGDQEQFIAKLRLIWRHRQFLFRVAALGLLLSTLVAFLIPKRYTAVSRLMPPDDRSSSGLAMVAAMAGQLGGLGSVAGDVLGVKSSGAVFVGVLQSRTVADRLIDRFNLKKVYRDSLDESAVQDLAKKSDISEDRKSGIITISVTDRDPQRSAAMARAYVEELDRLVAQLSTSSAHRERVFLEERLKTVKEDLDNAALRFGQFASKNTAIDIQAQGKAMVDAAAGLQGEMIAAKAEREGLKQIYTDGNVRVREVEARIGELQRQLDKLGGSSTPASQNAATSDDPSYPTIRQLPLLGVTYADLYRRTKIEETIYQVLTQQYELAKVEEAKETPTVRVLDAAVVPEHKSFPPRLVTILCGTMFSFALGVIAVFGSLHWKEKAPEDPSRVFAFEVLRDSRMFFSRQRAALRRTLHRRNENG
jgi:uncharacterized protein involved in exopolysaccharide biosynthesis